MAATSTSALSTSPSSSTQSTLVVGGVSVIPSTAPRVASRRLADLIVSVAPNQRFDAEAEALILQLADDFVESVVAQSAARSKLSGANTLRKSDIAAVLSSQWDIQLPALNESPQQPQSAAATSSTATVSLHKSRLAAISKFCGGIKSGVIAGTGIAAATSTNTPTEATATTESAARKRKRPNETE